MEESPSKATNDSPEDAMEKKGEDDVPKGRWMRGSKTKREKPAEDVELLRAAKHGRSNVVERLLRGGTWLSRARARVQSSHREPGSPLVDTPAIPVDRARDHRGRTALYIACARGHVNVVQVLLRFGAATNVASTAWRSPLHAAGKAPPNARDRHGLQPLHLACINGHVDCCRVLVEEGKVDVNAACGVVGDRTGESGKDGAIHPPRSIGGVTEKGTGGDGATPLHFACVWNHPDVAAYLVSQGALPDKPDAAGRSSRDVVGCEWEAFLSKRAVPRESIGWSKEKGFESSGISSADEESPPPWSWGEQQAGSPPLRHVHFESKRKTRKRTASAPVVLMKALGFGKSK